MGAVNNLTTPPNPLLKAIELVGKAKLASELKLTYQSFNYWLRAGRMPRTEWTGETDYASRIEQLTDGAVTRAVLLGKWEPLEPAPPQPLQEAA